MAFSAQDIAALGRQAQAAPRLNPYSGRLAALAEEMAGHAAQPAYSRIVLEGIVRFTEFVLVGATGFFVYALHVQPVYGYGVNYLVSIPLISAAIVFTFQALGTYRVGAFRGFLATGLRLAGGWTLVFLATIAAVFFLKLDDAYSRIWLMGWYATGFVVIMLERAVLSGVTYVMTKTGRLDRRTVIVGGGPAADRLLNDLANQTQADLCICGFFDDRSDERSPDVVAGYPKLGAVDDLVEFARHTRLDLVIFALPITAEQRLLEMLRKLWILPIDIRLAAHSNKLQFRPRSYSYIGAVPVLDVFDKPIADWDVVMKVCFDKIVGTIALLLLSPLMLLVALAIKLDSKGPILFKQKRYGFNNELVQVYKFRSMYIDQMDYDVKKQVTRGDPRVTRVGRFIRKTSLDELPQLFNVVFQNKLSLVGPRPHAIHARVAEDPYEEVVDGYFARHRVRPGMTGWAQIHGWRGETDTLEKIQRRVECDLYYIENWSILLDFYVLLATPFALLKAENAY